MLSHATDIALSRFDWTPVGQARDRLEKDNRGSFRRQLHFKSRRGDLMRILGEGALLFFGKKKNRVSGMIPLLTFIQN